MSLKKATQLIRSIVSRPAMMSLREEDVEAIIRIIASASQMNAETIRKDLCEYYDEEMKQ
jgi:hypothetical protein